MQHNNKWMWELNDKKKHKYINLLLPLSQKQINVVLKQLFWTEDVDHWEIKSSISISLCEKDLGFHHSDLKKKRGQGNEKSKQIWTKRESELKVWLLYSWNQQTWC